MSTLPDRIKDALNAAHDFNSFVHGLLGDPKVLNWPIEQRCTKLDDIAYAWTDEELRATGLNRHILDGAVWQIQPLSPQQQPWGIFLLQFANEDVFTKGRGMAGPLRTVLRGLVPSRIRAATLPSWKAPNILFICTHNFQHFTFAHFKRGRTSIPALSTFGWAPGQAGFRTLCEFNLPALRWPEDTADHDAWLKQWAAAFDKEALTKRFFNQFRELCGVVADDIARRNTSFSEDTANTEAQVLLERLLFLYFIQRKGWLNQRPDYLFAEFETNHRAKPKDESYYQGFLAHVFRRLSKRSSVPSPVVGTLPFLNGGLFEEDPEAFKGTTPLRMGLKVGNGVMASVFDDLLERYNFTIREDTPLDQDVAIDPEMLGKILECLVLEMEAAEGAPDKRKGTGSYYTPRIVVHFICREVLRQFLIARLEGKNWPARLNRLFDIDPSDGISAEELATLREVMSVEDAARIRRLIWHIKACDPAVGSGAFAVGLLHELVNLVLLCETCECGKDPRIGEDPNYIFRVKSHFIENAIYGVDILERAAEICKLRLWLSLIVDYQLSVDPFNCSPAKFASALAKIPALPNLDFRIRRGDSLLDQLHGHPIVMRQFAKGKEASNLIREMVALKSQFFVTDKVLSKRSLQRRLLARKLDLAELFIKQQIPGLPVTQDVLFGASDSSKETREDAARRRWVEEQLKKLRAGLADVDRARKELAELKPGVSSLSAEDEETLRRLEGQTGDRISFVWDIDFMEVFNRPATVGTFNGEFAIVNQVPGQKKFLAETTQLGGFDIIVGNPPFVTARNPGRREQYRERWPMVCYQKYSLVSPFFQCSFGLLAKGGHLGFIVSNAFAKREFGKPLVEDFFPTVDLTKIVDCSGLMFPGHGTPTCIVFGRNQNPAPESMIRVAAILPGGGDLETPPEESPLWHTIARVHEQPGYDDGRVVTADVEPKTLLRYPMSFDLTGTGTQDVLGNSGPNALAVLGDRVGPCTMTNADDVYVMTPDFARRSLADSQRLLPFQEGDEVRDWALQNASWLLNVYDEKCEVLSQKDIGPNVMSYLKRYRDTLENRLSFGNKTFKELGRAWYSFERMNANKYSTPQFITYGEIATHAHFVYSSARRIFERDSMTMKLPPSATADDHHLLAAVLNSSAALFWLKQVCFSKRESSKPEADTYYVFGGGKVEQLPVPDCVAAALSYRTEQADEGQSLKPDLVPDDEK